MGNEDTDSHAKKKRRIEIRQVLLGMVIGAIITVPGYLLWDSNAKSNEGYEFLARRIQIDNPNDVQINFSDLRRKVENYVENLEEGEETVSVYFEYLPTGVSINVNEKSETYAASLMKLPTVMSLYRAAELGKLNLDDEVRLKKEWLNDGYGTLYQKGEGYAITLAEAARLTLVDSDNTAVLAILDSLEQAQMQEDDYSLNYLDLEYNVIEDSRVAIGARSYSSILKCLYLSCYNNKDDSQEILKYLTESSFTDRLTRYLPEEVKVAHKIGTYNVKSQSDCGIVYVPGRQYALCVMVEGQDPGASDIIADISQITYSYVSALGTEKSDD